MTQKANDIQHNDFQYNDTQRWTYLRYSAQTTPNITMLSIISPSIDYRYAECSHDIHNTSVEKLSQGVGMGGGVRLSVKKQTIELNVNFS
jgi:hypothetical protein